MNLKQKPSLSRKDKVAELIVHHADLFKAIDVENPLYIPKCAYIPHDKDTLHMGFFPNELQKSEDIYTEFVSMSIEPEDPERILYVWKYNPYYEEEYELTTSKSSSYERYLIPVSELIKVEPIKHDTTADSNSDFPDFDNNMMDPDNDEPLARMTIKDLAAILLKKPVSDKKWLNKIIEKQ